LTGIQFYDNLRRSPAALCIMYVAFCFGCVNVRFVNQT
jgi:hypothetical protein